MNNLARFLFGLAIVFCMTGYAGYEAINRNSNAPQLWRKYLDVTTVSELFPGKNKVTLKDFESQLGKPTYPMWSKSEAAWVQVDGPIWRIFSVRTNDDIFPAEDASEVNTVVYQARLIIGDDLHTATQFKLQLEYHEHPWKAGTTQ